VTPAPATLPRPPTRSAPEVFYGDYLPQLWRLLVGSETYPGPGFRVGVAVDGLALTFAVSGSALTVGGDAREPTLAHFTFDREAYRVGTRDLWPRVLRRLEELGERVAPAMRRTLTHPQLPSYLAALAALPGTVHIDYADDAGDLIRCTVRIGSTPGPVATLRLGDTELDSLLLGRATLVGLARGRFVLEGDTGYLLRLLARLERVE
jgi:hypothetical protein